jgi:hypothetical protein
VSDRLRPEAQAELARVLEGWIDRVGLRAVTKVTNEVLRRRRRRGPPTIDDFWFMAGMMFLLAEDKALKPWAATARFASGVSESSRHSMRKRLFRKYQAQKHQFPKRYPDGVVPDAVIRNALQYLDQYKKEINQWCLDHEIDDDERSSYVEFLEELRCFIFVRNLAVTLTPEVTPDGAWSVRFDGSPSALDRAFTLLTNNK